MSSITFPAPRPQPSTSDCDDELYSSPFEATSSFQMNPLSAHPPRTPRTSIISSANPTAHAYSHVVFDANEGKEEADGEHPEEEDEEVEPKIADTRVRVEDVWRDLFLTSNGRDKGFKLMQYTIRLYLVFHTSVTTSRLLRRPTRPSWEEALVKRLQSTASGLSFSRKLLLLFNWLGPLTAIRAQQSVPFSSDVSTEALKKTQRPFLHTVLYAPPPVLLDLVNAISDDVATLSLLGLLGKTIGRRAERFSDWCWFLATLVGLVENGVERQMITNLQRDVESRLYKESLSGVTAHSKGKSSKHDETELARLQSKDFWLQMSRVKLVMDLIFVSYDLFKIQRLRESVKTIAGLTSAILSSAKLYHNQRNVIRKNLSLTPS